MLMTIMSHSVDGKQIIASSGGEGQGLQGQCQTISTGWQHLRCDNIVSLRNRVAMTSQVKYAEVLHLCRCLFLIWSDTTQTLRAKNIRLSNGLLAYTQQPGALSAVHSRATWTAVLAAVNISTDVLFWLLFKKETPDIRVVLHSSHMLPLCSRIYPGQQIEHASTIQCASPRLSSYHCPNISLYRL